MKKIVLISVVVIIGVAILYAINNNRNKELVRLRANYNELLGEYAGSQMRIKQLKIMDSLNLTIINSLEMKVSEYNSLKKENAEILNQLGIAKKELSRIITAQSETVSSIKAYAHDTVVITEPDNNVDAVTFKYHSKWTDVDGLLYDDTVHLNISNREYLHLIESVKYKRFLGFLWRTKKIKSRSVNIFSENPNTKIVDIEYINFDE